MSLESGKRIVVRPNPNKRNLLKYNLIVGRDTMGKDIEREETSNTRAPNTNYTVMAAPSVERNGYLNTGLDIMVSNPFLADKTFRSKEWEDLLKDKPEVLLEHVVEYKFKKAIGYYSNEVEHSKVMDVELQKKFNFWQSDLAMFDFKDGANILNLDLERDLITYYLIKADPLFANSYEELSPLTDYYIAAEHEEEVRKASKTRTVDIATGRLVEIDDEADGELTKKFGRGLNIRTKGLKKEKIYSEISAKLKENKDGFVEQFNFLYNLWKEPVTRTDFVVRTDLVELIEYGVINQRGAEYSWIPPASGGEKSTEMKWIRREDIFDFLKNPEYQVEKEQMEAQLNLKKSL